jgi:hypothetical protein
MSKRFHIASGTSGAFADGSGFAFANGEACKQ